MIYDSKTKDMQIILRNELRQAKMMRKHQRELKRTTLTFEDGTTIPFVSVRKHQRELKRIGNPKGNGYLVLRVLCLIIVFLSAFVGTLMFITDWEWQQHITYAIGTFAWFVCVPAFSLAFGYSFVMQGLE